MRVHTKTVIDIETGQVLEDEFYYSEESPAMCDFGTSVEAPPPPEKTETQLKTEDLQLKQLEKANMYSDLVTPVTLANAGYKMVTAPDGTQKLEALSPEERLAVMSPLDRSLYKTTLRQMGLSDTGDKLTEDQLLANMTDTERRNYELEKAYQERQLNALSGKLPVSPALEQDLAAQEKALSESLSQRLGPNWMLSTPGQKAMADFKQRAELMREEARRGQISTGEALIASRSADQGTKSNIPLTAGNYLSTIAGDTGNKLYSVPQLYGGLTQTSGSVIAPYQAERMKIYDTNVSASMQSAANKAALYKSLITGGGQMGAAYMGK